MSLHVWHYLIKRRQEWKGKRYMSWNEKIGQLIRTKCVCFFFWYTSNASQNEQLQRKNNQFVGILFGVLQSNRRTIEKKKTRKTVTFVQFDLFITIRVVLIIIVVVVANEIFIVVVSVMIVIYWRQCLISLEEKKKSSIWTNNLFRLFFKLTWCWMCVVGVCCCNVE